MDRQFYKNSGLLSCNEVKRIGKDQTDYLLNTYHYLGSLKTYTVSYGNDEGCCVFGVPRARKLVLNCPYKIIELIRMVGKEKHSWSMSSLMSKSINLLKKEFTYEVCITYSDPHAGHNGNTYRAANWIDLGKIIKDGHPLIFIDKKNIHPRSLYSKYGTSSILKLKEIFGNRLEIKDKKLKNKFIYFLTNKKDYLNFFSKGK